MARRRNDSNATITNFRHAEAGRKNNPPSRIAAEGTVPAIRGAAYRCSLRLDLRRHLDLSSAGGRTLGEYHVTTGGLGIYDPVDHSIQSTGSDKVATWFLDSDYDDQTFCITQAFFPDRAAWDKLARALKGVVDETAFDALSGTTSLPFAPGRHRRVAVKVIDPRGNEVMAVAGIG